MQVRRKGNKEGTSRPFVTTRVVSPLLESTKTGPIQNRQGRMVGGKRGASVAPLVSIGMVAAFGDL
jgi:hypothetical protein